MGGKLGWLNWFWQFLCKGLSSFKLNGFYHSYTWSCGSWEGRTYPFAQDLSLEKSADSYVYFKMTLLYVESYFFSLSQSPSLPLCLASDAISCNIDEVLSISPSANVFVFAWYEEVPPIIEGSKAPPPPLFSVSISYYTEGLNPSSEDKPPLTPPLMAIPTFYIFSRSLAFGKTFLTISS